jgi:hypothetical protein
VRLLLSWPLGRSAWPSPDVSVPASKWCSPIRPIRGGALAGATPDIKGVHEHASGTNPCPKDHR